MQNFSTTQATNYVSIAAVVVLLLQKFGIAVSQDEMLTIFAGTVSLIALITNVLNRYLRGDLTVLGFRKGE